MSYNYQTQEFNWSGVRSYVLIRVALLPKSTVSVIFCTQKLMYSKTCLMRHALGEKFCVGLHSTNKIKKKIRWEWKWMSDKSVKQNNTQISE